MLRSVHGKRLCAAIFLATCSYSVALASPPAPKPHPLATQSLDAPLPNAAVIRQRVLDNLKAMKAEQERYLCHITRNGERTDKHGTLQKERVRTFDMFFVNGREIDELTAKDGKALDAGEQKKESERVQKEIAKDSDEKNVAKEEAEDQKQIDILLHALRFTNGHRQLLNGRPTLFYNLSGDPGFHPKNVQETFLHNLTGTTQVDEATGQLVDLNVQLDHDVKIGGGLVANVHKGFWLHLHQTRQPDGVWINDLSEGKGDARAALFFHPYFQFRQTIGNCHLTDVTTQTSTATVAKP